MRATIRAMAGPRYVSAAADPRPGAAGGPAADDATLPPQAGDTELVVVRAMDTGDGALAAAEAEAEAQAQASIDAVRAPGGALGGYVLGELLGRGGMGEVVAAHDPQLGREVAVKRMRGGHRDPDAVERFVREAKIQARLDHPAIVPVHALGLDGAGLPYFAMKRLSGVTLAERLRQGGPIQPALRALVDACFAIELAHTRGVVHRDLKPSNLMLGDYGDVYVIDWGVARVVDSARHSAPSLAGPAWPGRIDTATGVALGTPGYMAPEQVRGAAVGAPADVYALGAILFEILAGEPLHPPGLAALAGTLAAPSASPAARRPDRAIAPELDALCSAALAGDPDARPSARALAEGLQRYLDGDRDLEQRRRLVDDHLAAARRARAAGQRSEAIHRAGRALALDPEAAEAAEIIAALIVRPPDQLPDEIEREIGRELAAAERTLDQLRARRGALAYAMIWVLVPLSPLLHIASWTALGALFAVASAMSLLNLYNARTGRVPLWLALAGHLAVVVAFSRIAGPFVLTPLLACGIAIAIGSHRAVADRPWIAIAWLVVAIALPVALELAGVLASTWRLGPDGLVSGGTIFDGRSTSDAIGILLGTVALAVVVGRFALSLTRARRRAQRTAHVQAWHLGQLLPRRGPGEPPAP
jgi:serine/threonine-protein kinase